MTNFIFLGIVLSCFLQRQVHIGKEEVLDIVPLWNTGWISSGIPEAVAICLIE